MLTRFSFLINFLILAFLSTIVLRALAYPSQTPSKPVQHSIRGRVLLTDSYSNSPTKISLAQLNGTVIGEKSLGYEGAFVYENLAPGDYLLTIERQNHPTMARPIQIKPYPTPKTVFLEVRLEDDTSATVNEVVKEYTQQEVSRDDEVLSVVSKKAAREFLKAINESHKGNHAKAIEHLEKAIREEPNFFEAYNNLGLQYQSLKQWERAIQAFNKAIKLRNDTAKPHMNLGNTYLACGRLDSAMESFKAALKFDENLVAAHLALGQIFYQKQDYEAAQKHLETATRLAPKQTKKAFILLAQIQILRKEYKRANYYLDRLFEYFPNDPEGMKMKGVIESLTPALNPSLPESSSLVKR